MISLFSNRKEITALSNALGGADKKIRKQLAIAVNKTAKKALAQLAKEDAKELATTQKVIKATMKVASKATATGNPTSTIVQRKTGAIPLRDFKARQTAAGVSYKISKRGKARGLVPSAFIVKSIAGHVFKRVGAKRPSTKGRYKGKMRQKIVKLYGPSPWFVTVKNRLTKPVVKFAKSQLKKEIAERTRFLNLKKSGAI